MKGQGRGLTKIKGVEKTHIEFHHLVTRLNCKWNSLPDQKRTLWESMSFY